MRASCSRGAFAVFALQTALLSGCTLNLPPASVPDVTVQDNQDNSAEMLEGDGEDTIDVEASAGPDAAEIADLAMRVAVDAAAILDGGADVLTDSLGTIDGKMQKVCVLPYSASPTASDVGCSLAKAVTIVFATDVQQVRQVAIADLDGTGLDEVAVWTSYTFPAIPDKDELHIFRTDGSLLFAGKPPIANGMAVGDVSGDVSGDCTSELIFSGYKAIVTMSFGNGTAKSVNQPWKEPLYGLIAADFTGDGAVDLAAESSSSVKILANDGNGHFSEYAIAQTFYSSSVLIATDLNADGKLDLVLQYGPSGIIASRNLGNGAFVSSNWLTFNPGSYNASMPSLGAADVDGDGLPEIVVTGTGYFAIVHWSQDKITLGKKFNWGISNFREFNCAGEPNSAVARGPGLSRMGLFQDNCLPFVLLNLGQAAFVPSVSLDMGPMNDVADKNPIVAAGRLDGDGWEDWAVAMPGQLWLIKSNCGK